MSNPVFANDLRRSIFRRRPVLATALLAALTALLSHLTFWGTDSTVLGNVLPLRALMFYSRAGRQGITLMLCIVPLIAPAFTAGAFAREREVRTLDALFLTRLSGSEILTGKFLASFLPATITSFVLAPSALVVMLLNGYATDDSLLFVVIGIGLEVLFLTGVLVTFCLLVSYYSPNLRTALAVSYLFVYAVSALANHVITAAADAQTMVTRYGAMYQPTFSVADVTLEPATVATLAAGAALLFLRRRLDRRREPR